MDCVEIYNNSAMKTIYSSGCSVDGTSSRSAIPLPQYYSEPGLRSTFLNIDLTFLFIELVLVGVDGD